MIAKSAPILSRRVNRTVIFPRFNRIRALRLRMPPSVWLPSFDILNSSILISELLDICARAAGISPRLSSAPSDVRTISPSWIRLSRVTGWKLFCSAIPKTTVPLTESTVAATCVVTSSQQPLARPQQSKKKEISAGNRINNPFHIATARSGVELDFNISQISAISTETCGNQRVNCTCRKSAVCTNRGELRSSTVRICPKSNSPPLCLLFWWAILTRQRPPESFNWGWLIHSLIAGMGLRLKYEAFTVPSDSRRRPFGRYQQNIRIREWRSFLLSDVLAAL